MAVRFSDGGDAAAFISSSFLCYFIVYKCYIYILLVYMFILSTYTFISLPRTPDCVMAEARITEFFGKAQTDGRSARKQEEVLDCMGLGSCMPREAWRLPSPQPLQKNSADAKATKAV